MTANDGFKAKVKGPFPDKASIRLSVERQLQGSGYGALKRVSCVIESGVLHLHGCVPSYYLKQLAQALVANIDGVCLVKNQIRVSRLTPGETSPLPSCELGKAATSAESG